MALYIFFLFLKSDNAEHSDSVMILTLSLLHNSFCSHYNQQGSIMCNHIYMYRYTVFDFFCRFFFFNVAKFDMVIM